MGIHVLYDQAHGNKSIGLYKVDVGDYSSLALPLKPLVLVCLLLVQLCV